MRQSFPSATLSSRLEALCDQLNAPDMMLWSVSPSVSVLWARVLRNQSRQGPPE